MSATPMPPATLPVSPATLPADPLFERAQYVTWDWRAKRGKPGEWTKPPFRPADGRHASHSRREDWGSRDQALIAMRRERHAGIGYVLTDDLGLVGLDWDKCRDPETGELAGWAAAWLARFASCAEVTPSGTGIRVFVHGRLPAYIPEGGTKQDGREVYAGKRFLTLTGHRVPGTPATVEARQDVLDAFLAEYFPPLPAPAPERPAPRPVDKSDEELLALALARSPRLARLWAGDYGDVEGDESRADYRAARHLAFWFAGDEGRVARVLQVSALRRDKWDERRGATTWLGYTVAQACADQTEHYDPLWRPVESMTGAVGDPATDPGLDPALPALLQGLDRAELERWALEQYGWRLEAERRAARSDRRLTSFIQIRRNRHIKAERDTLAAAVTDYMAERDGGRLDDKAFARQPNTRLADTVGKGPKAVAKHMERGESWGVLFEREFRQEEPVRLVDRETGEVTERPSGAYYIRLKDDPDKILDLLVHLDPTTLPTATQHDSRTWGGKRVACPDHPAAGTVKRWSLHCAECDQVLDRGQKVQGPADPEQAAPPPARETFVADRPGDWLEIMGAPATAEDAPPAPSAAADAATPKTMGEPDPVAVAADLARWLADGTLARVAGEVHAGGVTIAASELPGRVTDWLAQYQALADAPAVIAPGSLTGVAVRPGAGLHTALADVWRSVRPSSPAPVPIPLVVIPAPAPRPPLAQGDISYSYAPGPSPPARGGPRCMNMKCRAPMPDGDTGRYCPTCRADGWGG